MWEPLSSSHRDNAALEGEACLQRCVHHASGTNTTNATKRGKTSTTAQRHSPTLQCTMTCAEEA